MKEEEDKNGVFLKLSILIGVDIWYKKVFFFFGMSWFGFIILFNWNVS